ncbi:MAG: hypothetical protein DRJ52_11055 [Thermoprotei archaeon]|nr:MAG: hypothetical protein DRJ52_11055 [Thermoprotei archaeon]
MSIKGFNVLVINGEIDFTIRNITPLTIGAGKKPLDPIAPDIPLLLDSTGRPVIPGSTLKGFFRGNIERALLAYGVASASQILEDIFGKSVGEAWGSHMFFTDAYVEGEYKIMSRQHIMINPRTQGVQHGPFEQEYVVENTLFKSKIHFRNLPLSLLSLLELAVNLANLGIARLGRSKSRGYGQITIDMNNVKVLFVGDFDREPRIVYTLNLSKRIEGGLRPIEVEVVKQDKKVIVRDRYTPDKIEGEIIEELPFGTLCSFEWSSIKDCLSMVLESLKR